MVSELPERLEVVDGQEVIEIGQHRCHATDFGLIPALSETWVEPDQAIAAALKRLYLALQVIDVPSLAAVRYHDYHRPSPQEPRPPNSAKAMKAFGNPSAPSKVDDLG